MVIIFGTLYFYRLRYFDLGRANRIVHQSSVQWIYDFYFARVVIPRATLHLRPSHGVSIPFWLSVNCYCFAPHHKSLSLLSLVSVSTLFFPKIISRCICRMAIYICTSLRSRCPKDFGNQIRINLEVRGRTRAFVCVYHPLTPHIMTGAPATQVTARVVQFLTLSPSRDQHQISPCNKNAL